MSNNTEETLVFESEIEDSTKAVTDICNQVSNWLYTKPMTKQSAGGMMGVKRLPINHKINKSPKYVIHLTNEMCTAAKKSPHGGYTYMFYLQQMRHVALRHGISVEIQENYVESDSDE